MSDLKHASTMTALIDIGANLAHDSFDDDRDAVLDRAWRHGLGAIIITGSSLDSARSALALCQRDPARLFATAGVHPHHASDWNADTAAEFARMCAEPALVALGECGLDYFRDYSPHPTQRNAFAAQLELAAAQRKPLFLHQRDAHADFVAMLREMRTALTDVVVHCFTDNGDALDDYLALDCHIGITGWICDERRGKHLIDLVPRIPAHRLMIETDAPYLLPRTAPRQPSRRNEPCMLPWVLKAVAAARRVDVALLAEQTTATARRFFGLPPC